MHRHDGFWPAAIAHIGRHQSCLPVVAMDDVGHEISHDAPSDFRCHERKRCKALGVIRPVLAIRPQIGIARAVIEMRRIKHKQVEPFNLPPQQPSGPSEKRINRMGNLVSFKRLHHGRIARHECDDLDVEFGQGSRQRTRHISQAAGFHQRKHFRCNAQYFHSGRFAIMARVIRQTPLSVRRKRFASAMGSSPTTSPSGMTTPRSITTFFKIAFLPIST